jgi:hypothetical protein
MRAKNLALRKEAIMKRSLLTALLIGLAILVVSSLSAEAQNCVPANPYTDRSGWVRWCSCMGGHIEQVSGNPACVGAHGSGGGNSSSSYDSGAAAAAAEVERQRQAEAEAERKRQEDELRRQEEERQKREAEERRRQQEEFERNKAQALRDLKGTAGELGLKGLDTGDNMGLKGLGGNDSSGLGLKDISNSNSPSAPLTQEMIRNIPARVLEHRQPDVTEVDRKIRQAQEALRRLIRSSGQSEEQRLEWTAESLDASEDAEKLSLNLVLDLIDAHVDYQRSVNKEERTEVLNRLLNRTEAHSQEKGLHTIYGMLINRKEELERIQSEVMLANKTNNLREKLADLKTANNSEFTREDMFEIVTQIKDAVGVIAHKEFPSAVNLAGPAKDLLDSTYVIWKQADSMRRLSQIQGVQEKNLQAANSLRQYILKLEKQKQTASAGVASQVPAKPM